MGHCTVQRYTLVVAANGFSSIPMLPHGGGLLKDVKVIERSGGTLTTGQLWLLDDVEHWSGVAPSAAPTTGVRWDTGTFTVSTGYGDVDGGDGRPWNGGVRGVYQASGGGAGTVDIEIGLECF